MKSQDSSYVYGSDFNAPTVDEHESDEYSYENEDENEDSLYPVESEYIYVYEDEVESVEIVETFGEDFYEKTEQRHIYAWFNYDDVMNAATALAELP